MYITTLERYHIWSTGLLFSLSQDEQISPINFLERWTEHDLLPTIRYYTSRQSNDTWWEGLQRGFVFTKNIYHISYDRCADSLVTHNYHIYTLSYQHNILILENGGKKKICLIYDHLHADRQYNNMNENLNIFIC